MERGLDSPFVLLSPPSSPLFCACHTGYSFLVFGSYNERTQQTLANQNGDAV